MNSFKSESEGVVMQRKFNVTGLCVPSEHYMVDISNKIEQIKELVDRRHYFTINRGRQYGKTTTLLALKYTLETEYTVVLLTFEGLGHSNFSTQEIFCQKFIKLFSKALKFTDESKAYRDAWENENVIDFETLSEHIADMCEDKKIILIIDEVDKTSNNQIYLDFLSMLRKKYLARAAGQDFTFHSVILAGVYDVRNLKWKIKLASSGEVESSTPVRNSPWNIAVNFDIDMSFNPEEIKSMIDEYEKDYATGMNTKAIANEIHKYTSGYPFLVSRICQFIHNELDQDWTIENVRTAAKLIQEEKNTLFDDLYKNLNNNEQLSNLIKRLLLNGRTMPYNLGVNEIDLGVMYGYFSKDAERGLVISNKIFENMMMEYFIDMAQISETLPIVNSVRDEFVDEGKFDMKACLERFAEYYPMIYSEKQAQFLEREGLLIFLMLLIPALNGKGFYYIEPQTRNEERMDLIISYGGEEFIVELKLWRGNKKHELAYEQLHGYLESRDASTGYLLTFDFRQNKEPRVAWVEYKGKLIFDVVV